MSSRRSLPIQVAKSVPFKNSDNGFAAKNTQAAIEEIDFRELNKEPTGFADIAQSTISWDNTNRRLTITPVSTSFTYYIRGKKYIKTAAESVDITDTEGIWYIHYLGDVLTASQTAWKFDDPIAFVVVIYWDALNDQQILFGEERHGTVMDWRTHEYLHQTVGAQVEFGTFMAGDYILGADGSLDAHARLSIGNGYVHDEDLIHDVRHAAIPAQPFEQILSPIAYIPVYYRSGVNGDWRKIAATQFALAYDTGGGLARYNKVVGGSWSLVNASDGFIIASWIFATNNINEPIIAVIGQMESSDLSEAASEDFFGNLELENFPFIEAKLLYRAFFRTCTTCTNTPKAVLGSLDGLLIPNIVPSPVVNYKVTSAIQFNTTSTIDTIITGMSVTPQSGTYAVWFSSDLTIVQNNALVNLSIYRNGTQLADSERTNQGASSNFETQSNTITTVTVDGTQVISAQIRVSTGTIRVNGRSLLLIRLGA